MWVLFLGDIVGKPGRTAAAEFLSRVRAFRDVDLAIANGENTASGTGLTEPSVRELFDAGVDVLTGGNHIWDKKEGVHLVRSDERILRPANYPPGVDGRGWGIFRGRSGTPYAVISLQGRVFMGDCDCPFRWADEHLPAARKAAACVFVDFHAEATSEKRAMGIYLDGRVSAVAGTHTHVQTSDAQLLPKGTGYITDAGMCGLGVDHRVDADASCAASFSRSPCGSRSAPGSRRRPGCSSTSDPANGTCRRIQPFI